MRMKLAATAAIALTALPLTASADGEVNIYSYRQAYLLEPLLNAFTDETGVKTNVVFAKQGLAERLEREGRNSPADIRSEEHTSELQSRPHLVCRLLLEKKK